MIDSKKILAVIPARGGSKGIPKKNLREVGGKSLIVRAIESAQASKYIDTVIVSTDDQEIADASRRAGAEVPFLRPAELASDTATSVAAALHAINEMPDFEWLVWLQPTSPFRTAKDIDACLEACFAARASSCVSVSEPDQHPYWTFTIDRGGRLKPVWENPPQRRQDLPCVFNLNGMVYVIRISELKAKSAFMTDNTVGHVIRDRWRCLDIDTEEDMLLADYFSSRSES